MHDNIPIFLASNDKYAPFVATTIASVCYNTKSFCNFYVLDSGISNLNKKRIELLKEKFNNFSIEYLKVDLNKFKNFQLLAHISLDTYSRFFIPILKPELDKVIYIDVDVSVLGDIKELYNVDLKDHFLGATPEYYAIDCQMRVAKNLDIKYNKNKQFFNAGILLINSKKWRENNITDKLFEIQNKYNNVLEYGDQDVLIKEFYEDYIELDSRFNLLSGQLVYKSDFSKEVEDEVNRAIKSPIIRHFETSNKPWLTNENFYGGDLQNFNDFWFFAEMTNFHKNILFNYFNNTLSTNLNNVLTNYLNNTLSDHLNINLNNILNNYFNNTLNSNLNNILDNYFNNTLNNNLNNILTNYYNNTLSNQLNGILNDYFNNINKTQSNKDINNEGGEHKNVTYIKLFNFIPLVKIYEKNKRKEYKLFNFIPILKIKKK